MCTQFSVSLVGVVNLINDSQIYNILILIVLQFTVSCVIIVYDVIGAI